MMRVSLLSINMNFKYGGPAIAISAVTSKMLGVGTDSMIQGVIVLLFGSLIGVKVTSAMVIKIIPLMLLVTVGTVCIGLTMASFMPSLENYGAIMTFVNLPMFLLSGALFPVNNLPQWLLWAVYINPLTYGVDAMRTVVLGSAYVSPITVYGDLLFLTAFDVIMILVGTYAFSMRK